MEDKTGKIEQPKFSELVVACVVCRERKPVLLYPHRLDGLVVGWVFVCADDQQEIQGADIRILPKPKAVTLAIARERMKGEKQDEQ